MSNNQIEIVNALLCEDIRQEKSNKYIIIGVFTGDIIVKKLPATIPICVFIQARMANTGETAFTFRLSGPGEGSITMEMLVNSSVPNEVVTIIPPKLQVTINEIGVIKAEFLFKNGRQLEIFVKNVTQSDEIFELSPIASQPPSERSPPDAPAS